MEDLLMPSLRPQEVLRVNLNPETRVHRRQEIDRTPADQPQRGV